MQGLWLRRDYRSWHGMGKTSPCYSWTIFWVPYWFGYCGCVKKSSSNDVLVTKYIQLMIQNLKCQVWIFSAPQSFHLWFSICPSWNNYFMKYFIFWTSYLCCISYQLFRSKFEIYDVLWNIVNFKGNQCGYLYTDTDIQIHPTHLLNRFYVAGRVVIK